jgi:serine/threonine protein phosphatase PrpC
MLCPSCRAQNRENARFCKGCGQILVVETVITDTTQPASSTVPVETVPDKTVAAWPASVSTTTPVPSMPQATPLSEEPTQYLPPQSSPQSTQRNQPVNSGEYAGTVSDENDLSLVPTQILTPAQMMEYHSRRWQQEILREQGQQSEPGESPDTASGLRQSQANAPTVYVPSSSDAASAPTVYGPNPPDAANAPTVYVPSSSDAASAPTVYGPNPPDAASAPTVYVPNPPDVANAPTVYVPNLPGAANQSVLEATSGSQVQSDGMSETPGSEGEGLEQAISFEEDKSMEHNQESANEKDEATPAVPPDQQTEHAFPVLTIGTVINNRYEVTQIVKSEQDEHVYGVLDRKGYLHCWSCDSEENAEGDEYCVNCGAQLFEVTYLMHEYPATVSGAGSQEAGVLPAALVDTIVENGHTYVIEQPQTEEDTFSTGVHLLAASGSDAGNLRRSDPNEDSALVLFLQREHESLSSPAGIFLVADGLGGHSNGQYASRVAINVIAGGIVRDLFLSPLNAEKEGEALKQWDEESLLALLQGAIEEANRAICQVNQRDKTDMGCTLTGFMIVGDRAYIFNVGDSRTYILRDDKIYQLTKDHSLVGQLVEGGLIEPDDVYSHPQRSQIYRSIGDKLNVQIDFFKQQIHPGDILLSCSDGLWEMVRDPQIAELLIAAPDPQTASTQLIQAANANGGEDNVSAVVVFVR